MCNHSSVLPKLLRTATLANSHGVHNTNRDLVVGDDLDLNMHAVVGYFPTFSFDETPFFGIVN